MRWRPSWTAFSFEGGSSAVALGVHLDDGGVVNEAIDSGEGHGGIREDPIPFAEWLVGGDQHRAAFVACTENRCSRKPQSTALPNITSGCFMSMI